jgi:HNH endonuclease
MVLSIAHGKTIVQRLQVWYTHLMDEKQTFVFQIGASMSYKQYRLQVWAKTQGHCWYCGKQMNPFDDFTIEHQVSQANGGTDDLPSLVPACSRCNSMKRAKGVEEFRAYLVKKGQWRFWGERYIPDNVMPEILLEDIADECELDRSGYVLTIKASFEIAQYLEQPAFAPVLLTFVTEAATWQVLGQSRYEYNYDAFGILYMPLFIRRTGLTGDMILTQLFYLLRHDIISFCPSNYSSYGRGYTLHLMALWSLQKILRRWQQE